MKNYDNKAKARLGLSILLALSLFRCGVLQSPNEHTSLRRESALPKTFVVVSSQPLLLDDMRAPSSLQHYGFSFYLKDKPLDKNFNGLIQIVKKSGNVEKWSSEDIKNNLNSSTCPKALIAKYGDINHLACNAALDIENIEKITYTTENGITHECSLPDLVKQDLKNNISIYNVMFY